MRHHLAKVASAPAADIGAAAVNAAKTVQHAVGEVPGIVRLTKDEKRRVVKLPIGADRYISEMIQLATEDASLKPKNVDPAATQHHLDVAEGLATLRAELADALAMVDATRLVAYGAAYSDALDILARARAHARTEPEIEKNIAGFVEFLRKPRKKAVTPKA